METQVDYETQQILAVFRSTSTASAAQGALRAVAIEHSVEPLAVGRYQLADRRLRRNTRAALRAAAVGAIVGAAIGGGAALWLLGASVQTVVWLAIGVAGGGAVIGGFLGVQFGVGYDDDLARSITITSDAPAILLTTRTSSADRGRGRVRGILQHAGAVAFLDAPVFDAHVRATEGPRIVDSTSA